MILYTARYTKGDAHISIRSVTANYRLIYAQTTKYKEYFDLVFGIFKSFCTKNYISYYYNRLDRRTKETYISVSFTTMQLPCFNEFREMFYVLNTKIVSINIYDLLTPRELAFWIINDGSCQGAGLHLSTYSFSNEDTDRLMFTLQDKFGLKCSIYCNRDNKPRIYIFKVSMDNLKSLVSPYFIEEMLYKL
jgi:LAGLIDADG DNA endonuclease family